MENDWLVIVEGLDDLYWMYSTVRINAAVVPGLACLGFYWIEMHWIGLGWTGWLVMAWLGLEYILLVLIGLDWAGLA